MTYLAVALPLIVTALVFRLLPVRLDRFVSAEEFPSLHERVPAASTWTVAGVQLSFLLVGAVAAVAIGGLQYGIACLRDPIEDAVFAARPFDLPLAHFGPNLLVGIVVGALFNFHLTTLRGRQFVRSILPVREAGVSLYFQIRILTPAALVIALLAVAFNFWLARSELVVTSDEIRHQDFFKVSGMQRPVSELRAVNTYRKRRAPIGDLVENRYVELEFADGGTMDTFHEVEDEALPELLDALRRVCPTGTSFRELEQKDG